jgi:C4-dicarboxylate transporter/malic acid transport protein
MHHFTWAWFTLVMSTGGVSLLLFAQPHQVPAFRQIGFVVWVMTVILFVLIVAGMITRFVLFPGDLKASITHPREGFFVPTFFLSCATLITSTHRYTIPYEDLALQGVIQTIFWGYVIVTLFLAIFQYSYLFASHSFGLQTMMPTWILPIFPIMLSGTISSVIADTQPDIHAVPIAIGGLTCQGLGMSVALIMYSHMVGRLMQSGLPNREHRPGLFMNVGPPSFTALAIIGMANGLPDTFDAGTGLGGVLDAAVLRTLAIVGAVFLWGLSLWWFGVAVVSVLLSRPKYFHLGFWAMVFPNTGFILATISLGNAFKSEPVLYVANAMSVFLIITYLTVLVLHVRAVIKQDIMYPGRDEDVNDH